MKKFQKKIAIIKLLLITSSIVLLISSIALATLNLDSKVVTPTNDNTPSFIFSSDSETGVIIYS